MLSRRGGNESCRVSGKKPAVFIPFRHEISRPLGLKGSALRGRYCYVEFVLEHSPSVSVRLRLFLSILRPSITFFPTILSFSVPFRPIRVRVMFRLILSVFHIRIRLVFSEFRPRFILLPLLFGYNPYQPNPIIPRFLIIFCSLLFYDPFVPIVPICINYDKL